MVDNISIMATLKFTVRGTSNPSTIYARFTDGRKLHIIAKTDFLINPEFWDEVKSTPKQKANNPEKLNLGIELGKLNTKIFQEYEKDKGTGIQFNKEWLELVIAKFKNPQLEQKTEHLIDLVREYQTEMKTKINPKTKRQIAQTTIRNFNTTLMRLDKFEKHKKKQYLINEIDLNFFREFVRFEKENLLLAQNSISKDIKQIKTVCIDAKEKGFEINKQVEYKSFNVPNEKLEEKGKKLFVTITESEIELIKKFKGVDYLENARDWLIIGCWTGCRVNDLMKLSKNNILMTPQGQKFIRYTQSKTGKQVDIPIHSHVNEILERLNGFPRPITDVKFNEYIKIVCKQAGIIDEVQGSKQNKDTHRKEVGTFQKYELIRSHTCRRSFATNHYNKLSNKLIMAVTGHATEQMLLNYIGETENTHLEDFLNVWSNDKKENAPIIDLKKKSV